MIKRSFISVACILCSLFTYAWEYDSSAKTVEYSVQMRVGADFTKKWRNGIHLGISEDARFDVYNNLTGAAFSKSYTTLTFSYSPIPYFKFDAGYVLKLMGNKDWSVYNEFLRHRVFMSVTGTYKTERWKLYLRERAMLEMRTDSINPLEKNQYDCMLRSRIGFEYTCFSKPLKPYAWIEVVNTLNAPEYKQKNGHQYIRRVRTAIGLKYRVDSRNSLNFFYRFNYGYDRDINITKKEKLVQLTEEYGFQNAIGFTYEFGW